MERAAAARGERRELRKKKKKADNFCSQQTTNRVRVLAAWIDSAQSQPYILSIRFLLTDVLKQRIIPALFAIIQTEDDRPSYGDQRVEAAAVRVRYRFETSRGKNCRWKSTFDALVRRGGHILGEQRNSYHFWMGNKDGVMIRVRKRER